MSAARLATLRGRLVLLLGDIAIDVAEASGHRFGPDPQTAYDGWDEFVAWMSRLDGTEPGVRFEARDLGPSVPRPSQVFAIGLNYADHASEAGMVLPTDPIVFTKFASSLTGADAEVRLTGDRVDWEAELVVVIGQGGRDIPTESAWDRVAGLAVGQDLSDRTVQNRGSNAQFNLGKSFAGFSPIGPVTPLASLEPGADRDALAISSELIDLDGSIRPLQQGNTRDMVFSVPELLARLSAIVELRPGDLIFTGTPSGVGIGRDPQVFLEPGQVLTTRIEGLGSIRQRLR